MLLGAPDRGRRYYECRDCLTRGDADETLAACPDGGGLRNLAVARE